MPSATSPSASILKRVTPIAAPHLLSDTDLSPDELRALLRLAIELKRTPGDYRQALAGRYIALLFEKPSLRTRMTFELAVKQLGGDAIFQDHRDGRIGEREPARDMARNLERWVQAIVARTFEQKTIEELAHWSSVPVINALSGKFHPCQALADFQTLAEKFGELQGLKMAFVGDGNNVCHSLMLCASRLGVSISVATPRGYEPDSVIIAKASGFAHETGAEVVITNDVAKAVKGVSAIYTDMWTSMGWESETQQRRIAFTAYQVTADLMARAAPGAVFMHCLPALRGEEVTDAVIESEASVVFDQAENRLHAQKALLLMMIGARGEEGG
jgi:ornithine carbamoyltransferase